MLGILLAGAAVIGVVVSMMIRRDVPLFILIAIFVLTAELGYGFSSFQGSIFFNQDFLSLASLKLVEVILYAYTGLLVLSDVYNRRKLAPSPLRRLYWIWLAWLVVLLFVQFKTRGSIDPIAFRNVYFSWALLYVFSSVTDSRLIMRRVIIFTFVTITVKALLLIFMFAIGRGDLTPRGRSPIFWDDKLLGAFTWAFLVFLVSIIQPRKERSSWPMGLVSASMAVIAVLIALSLRRNYLGQVAIGTMFVLFNKGHQVQLQRFLSLALVVAALLGALFTAGQVVGDRLPLVKHMTEYAQLLNFTSLTTFGDVSENQVHLFNVQTYTRLLSEYEGIRLFGTSAAPTQDFRDFNREYLSSLGLAHNGPLRAIFENGVGGLVVWAGFFYLTFRAFRRCQFTWLDPWERALVIGTAATVFAHFIVTLTVIPPFFTTFKSFFFFLFMVYVVEFYGRESRVLATKTTEPTLLNQSADHYSYA
jgi:hypothetical protein